MWEDTEGNVYDDTGHFQGRWLHKGTVAWADKILEAEKEGGPWNAIEEMINYWKGKYPKEYQSMLVEVDDLKKSRASDTGASKSKSTRYLANIPAEVWMMIQAFYKDKGIIDIYSKDFFTKFARRFPEFAVAERI